MKTRHLGAVAAVLGSFATLAACGADSADPADGAPVAVEQALFDCNDPGQVLTCAPPANPKKRFVCHATGWPWNPYVKLSVKLANKKHVPGVAHKKNRVDQAPGASADDVGSGPGLDCECEERVCADVCTGAPGGAACDDGDLCTGDGTCLGDACQSGAPSCTAGLPVDDCNVQGGACDAASGACGTEPLPAGTSCEGGQICDGAGDCVECIAPDGCPGVDDACGTRTCTDGSCGVDFAPAGTACGAGLVCDGSGACVGVPHVVLNEVESSGGVPGDWVELRNVGTAAADVSGWKFLDNDDTHVAYVIPAGTTIAVGAYLVLDEASFGFGLGSADSARLFDASSTLVDSHTWSTHAATTYGRCPDGTGAFGTTNAATKGAANDCTVAVKINEVESSGGVPGDWVELYNAGPIPADVSGWVFKDNDDAHAYVIPPGTTIAAGAYLVLDEATFGFGLGSADAARLYDAQAVLTDSYTWATHAAITYGRCPNGTGAFATTTSATKGATNACSGGPSGAEPWPGQNMVGTVDGTSVFGGNLSGLFYEGGSPNVLWAVRNGPSTLYRLVHNGSIWTPEAANGWDAGKTLRYPDGTGSPDAEDVTRAELGSTAVYVATERDNDVSAVSRLSILRFDSGALGAELTATHEWNVTADLPPVGSNLGLEAITWIPDTFLVASSFFDTAANQAYDPSQYPGHSTGLFFVGVEATGLIYAYALDHNGGGFTRIATIVSGDTATKALSFDREVGYLWTSCSSNCDNQTAVLVIDTAIASPTFGKFKVLRQFARPSTMPNLANEGIAIAPESQCVGGQKPFLWSDDGETGGHALRADSIPCGPFIP